MMRRYPLAAIGLLLVFAGCSLLEREPSGLCSAAWYQKVDDRVGVADGQGHGPDPGSAEWTAAVEFLLGIGNRDDLPAAGSEAWCQYVDREIAQQPEPTGPSFDCSVAASGSIEALVCRDRQLAVLDRGLDAVYRQAEAIAVNEQPPTLQAEQRGWIKGRDDCWKADDVRACVQTAYLERTAELQARYRLVEYRGPYFYACDGNPANEVAVTYFETLPPTLIAERGDSVSLMYRQPAASGTFYQGRNESFREHQGEATLRWGYEATELTCRLQP